MIKIAAIHNAYLPVPENANPAGYGYEELNAFKYVKANIQRALNNIETAGKNGADICCTHEDFVNSGVFGYHFTESPGLFYRLAEKTAGEVRHLFAAAAQKYNMLIAANNYEPEKNKLYNTSTLYGRDGLIIGQYRKVHLPPAERWGVTAGDDFPVFKTDIGHIGFMTCYDVYFPEHCRALALGGADIVIHQTQGWGWNGRDPGDGAGGAVGEAFMRVRACENNIYLVTSKVMQNNGKDGGRSVVVDNFGRILADSGTSAEKLIYAEFEPDFTGTDKYAYGSLYSGLPGLRPLFMLSRRPEAYGALTDDAPEILKRYPGMRIMDSPAEAASVIEGFGALPEEERQKYHW